MWISQTCARCAHVFFALLFTAQPLQATSDRPNVLLIGDSISLGYTPHVVQLLEDTADVRHHKGNAQHTGTGLRRLDDWLGDTSWDVIHFNWGLWDLCYRHPESTVQGRRDKVRGTLTTTPQQYAHNLEQLVRRLKQTGAKLIWASTTVVPEGEAGRKRGDDLKYNQIAAAVMRRHGVTINDLNAASRNIDAALFTKPGDVHFQAAGYRQLAVQVAAAVRSKLNDHAGETVSRLHFGSCIKQDREIPILKTIVADHPQLFVFLGDNIYGDTQDMTVMSAKYAALAAKPLFAQLRKQSAIMATWDDHDFGVNDGGAEFPQRSESRKLFLDFWRPGQPQPPHEGVYQSTIIGPPGQRLQIILLDTRYFRSPLKRGERRTGGPWVPDANPEKTMLGEAQWAWLKEQLTRPAERRVIASSIQFIATDAGQETWSNLPTERQRMLQLLKDTGADNVCFISGDRHWSEFSVLQGVLDGPLYDFTSSSLNQQHSRGTPTQNEHRLQSDTFHAENFGVLLFDWSTQPAKVTCRIRDIDGRVVLEHAFD